MKSIDKSLYSRLKPSMQSKVNNLINEKKEENLYTFIECLILVYCALKITPVATKNGYFSMNTFFEIAVVCIVYLTIHKVFANRREEINKNRGSFEKSLYVEPCICKNKCTCKEELISYLKSVNIM